MGQRELALGLPLEVFPIDSTVIYLVGGDEVAMSGCADPNALESLYLSMLQVVVACCGIYGISIAVLGAGGKIRCRSGINSKSLARTRLPHGNRWHREV